MEKDILKLLKLIALFIVVSSTLIFILAYIYIHGAEIKQKRNAQSENINIEESSNYSAEKVIADYQHTVDESKFIIHALGGMEEKHSYVNSIDCLETVYEAGYRLFEADISFTSDNVLVLAHSGENNIWSKNDWEKRLGQTFPDSKSSAGNTEKNLCDYATFMNFKIQGKYKATDLSEIFDFMYFC